MEEQEEPFFDCEENLNDLETCAGKELNEREATRENADNIVSSGNTRDSEALGSTKLDKHFEELSINGPEGEPSERGAAAEEANEGLDREKADTEEQEEWMSSEAELKEELSPEYDDEHLRELEEDLTDDEKETRRKESMTLKEKGNCQFKKGEHVEAEESYTAALHICPVSCTKERSILFSNRAASRMHQDKKEEAIKDCSKAIELNPDYVRALLRRAELYEKTEKLDEALEDYKNVLERDPGIQVAREACMRLPQQIHERNEKLKEEMMSKLKDLGNMFLRPFGLSTSNFQVNQDPNSGSYSVNFVQNQGGNRR